MKTKLRMHKTRHQRGELEVLDSASFCVFGEKYLATPGPRSGIEKRTFHELRDEDIKARAEEVCLYSNMNVSLILLLFRLEV